MRVEVVDSHTGGEPTRVVLTPPELGPGTVAERAARFAEQQGDFRRGVVAEPRGGAVWVGALVVPPDHSTSVCGVIFFNTVGVLGMCGHGLIGLVTTLAARGTLATGPHQFDTPAGPVTGTLLPDGRVRIRNVPSYRARAGVRLNVPGIGPVVGDIAWGGNWFFLTDWPRSPNLAQAAELTQTATAIRQALQRATVTAPTGAAIDHIELCGPAMNAANHGRNFVLCPGLAFDRSPCGTGTSAKLACLAADNAWPAGRVWRQESITGSVFEAEFQPLPGNQVVPTITGQAWIMAETVLHFHPADPFRWGLDGANIFASAG